ncbi:splicing factor 45 [Ischnura elegans]|uniref:splicing factor 45 n=1 Tax=Ischnura elegans TaxID=197161 RepID=UPI001ED89260|nr:splicing factor 45 [Ischnura elegans]
MSLYDDLDAIKEKADQVAGWSSGIKLFQTQLQLKKTAQSQAKREQSRKPGAVLPPVIDLKSRKEDDDSGAVQGFGSKDGKSILPSNAQTTPSADLEWNGNEEYDPLWPNDYEKVVKELRERREREREKEDEERRRKHKEERDKRTRERFDEDRRKTGFGGRKGSEEEDEEEEDEGRTSNGDSTEGEKRTGGVAIAPPPSLQEGDGNSGEGDSGGGMGGPFDGTRQSFTGEGYGMGLGGSVAAKIMAKYGFKEGQGLGKQEQGISMALQVEKTSKRGGRIISEKDIMPPPVMGIPPVPLAVGPVGGSMPPPSVMPPPAGLPGAAAAASAAAQSTPKPEPTITEMMKNPSKVVLLRNMVGPGEVDEDLEPEVKEECNTKYGDVIRVLIYEMPNVPHDEAVRIFVEFKRIESAIKAVVDLNGRYFGGRQVKAGFYLWEKLNNLELAD